MLSHEPAARITAGILLATAASAWTVPLQAQTVPPGAPQLPPDVPPQQVQPGRDQIGQPAPDAAAAPPSIRVNADAAIRTAPCPLADYDVQVQIRTIRLVGPSVLSEGGQPAEAAVPAEIQTLLADIVNAPPPGSQPVKVVCDVRDKATERLRRAGYVATVQIPPQRIEDGELKLEVVTARIVEMRVRGEAGPYRDTLQARIDQLKALSPLNERDAERILLLAGDIPGLDVQLALRPANGQPGEVIGELTVVYKRFAVLANLQNYGSRQLGRETGYVRGEFYGLTGASDVTYLGASTTADFEEQIVVQGGHIMGLGAAGTTLAGTATYAWTRPDLDQLDLRSRSLISRIELAQPLRRSIGSNLGIAGGFELIEQRTRQYIAGGSQPVTRDKLRVLFARIEGSARRVRPDGIERWSLRAEAEVRKGIDVFNATKGGALSASGYSPSRFFADPTATVIRGELDAIVGIGPVFSLYGGARGQWSNNALLNFEEYTIGNLTFGRGYDPGANSSDRAVAVRGEARAQFVNRPDMTAQIFGFYDSVWIWNLDPGSIEDDRRLGSWGGGVRITLPRRAVLEAIYAHPQDIALISIPNAKRASDRFLVSLTAQFGPGL